MSAFQASCLCNDEILQKFFICKEFVFYFSRNSVTCVPDEIHGSCTTVASVRSLDPASTVLRFVSTMAVSPVGYANKSLLCISGLTPANISHSSREDGTTLCDSQFSDLTEASYEGLENSAVDILSQSFADTSITPSALQATPFKCDNFCNQFFSPTFQHQPRILFRADF